MSSGRNDPRILRGMETQLELRQARLNAGAKPLGWKVGFGAPAALERLRIDAPLVGFLTDETLLASAATASLAGWTNGIAEPEIAVYLGQDLVGAPDRETTRAAIVSIGPILELADVSFPPDDVEAILAGNIYHRQAIFGGKDTSRAGCNLAGLVARVYRNGTEIAATAEPQALTGDIVDVVRHVANLLTVFGERLRAGQVIIAGSIVPPIRIAGKEEIRYTLDPVDTISVYLDT
jgi:2-keto-4-pentenoate hydratase